MSKAKTTDTPNVSKAMDVLKAQLDAAEAKKQQSSPTPQEPIQAELPEVENVESNVEGVEKPHSGAELVITVKPEDDAPKFKDLYKGQIIFMRHDQIEDLKAIAKATNRGINEIGRLAMDFFLQHVRVGSEDEDA